MATFVLTHGASHGGWCWDRVRPYLTRVRRPRLDSSLIYGRPCPEFPARRVPVTYIRCLADRALDGAWNAAWASELLDAGQRELPAGYSLFWSAHDQEV